MHPRYVFSACLRPLDQHQSRSAGYSFSVPPNVPPLARVVPRDSDFASLFKSLIKNKSLPPPPGKDEGAKTKDNARCRAPRGAGLRQLQEMRIPSKARKICQRHCERGWVECPPWLRSNERLDAKPCAAMAADACRPSPSTTETPPPRPIAAIAPRFGCVCVFITGESESQNKAYVPHAQCTPRLFRALKSSKQRGSLSDMCVRGV